MALRPVDGLSLGVTLELRESLSDEEEGASVISSQNHSTDTSDGA